MKGRRLGDGTGETDNLQTNDTGQKKRPRGSLGSTRKTSAICFVPSDGISTHLFMYATKYPQTPSVFPKIDCNNNETELRITCNIQILKLKTHMNLTYNPLLCQHAIKMLRRSPCVSFANHAAPCIGSAFQKTKFKKVPVVVLHKNNHQYQEKNRLSTRFCMHQRIEQHLRPRQASTRHSNLL